MLQAYFIFSSFVYRVYYISDYSLIENSVMWFNNYDYKLFVFVLAFVSGIMRLQKAELGQKLC